MDPLQLSLRRESSTLSSPCLGERKVQTTLCVALELPSVSGYGLTLNPPTQLWLNSPSLNIGGQTRTQYSRLVLFLFISLQKMAHKSQMLDD